MKHEQLKAAIKALPKETIKAIAMVNEGDGHSIFDPQAYADAGMPEELLAHFCEVHKSDGTHKGSIFDSNGRVLRSLDGVYGLRVSSALVSSLDLEAGNYMGRGFQARANHEAILKYCDGVTAVA